jgi:hypothetical protein
MTAKNGEHLFSLRQFFVYFYIWRALECVGHSFAYVAHFVWVGGFSMT